MAATAVCIEVDRPADEVFAYATDPARFHEWQQGVVDGRIEGDECVMTRRIGGANRTSRSAVTHVDPPRTWGVRGIDGPIRATVELTVEPLGAARSRISISVGFVGHGIGALIVPFVRRQARAEMPANVEALRRRLEARGT